MIDCGEPNFDAGYRLTEACAQRDEAEASAIKWQDQALRYLGRIERLERERDALREALIEAREDIVHWAGYASDYFKDKHDYIGDLARIDAALEAKP